MDTKEHGFWEDPPPAVEQETSSGEGGIRAVKGVKKILSQDRAKKESLTLEERKPNKVGEARELPWRKKKGSEDRDPRPKPWTPTLARMKVIVPTKGTPHRLARLKEENAMMRQVMSSTP